MSEKALFISLPVWTREVINVSFWVGGPACLKKLMVKSLHKKPSLYLEDLSNYQSAANLSFLGKVLKWVIADQIHALLEETPSL